MWTEAGRRSQEAVDSVQGPRPGWPEAEPVEDFSALPPPTRPLIGVRLETAATVASFSVPAAVAIAHAASAARPTGDDLWLFAGGTAYISLLNLLPIRRVRRSSREPAPWPAGLTARKPIGTLAALAALSLAACVFVLLVAPHAGNADDRENRWLLAALLLGGTLGPAIVLAWIMRRERELGVRLYREPTPWFPGVRARRAARVRYAGPPPAGS